ncbi:hypothetical protein Htur_4206 (plasmid) [Haloterrigena turkmenica DSM 5511]|uniref:Halobacterial output domain-containing protein n=1 Tax=Haloterrigena turkmenica (strain ATCC 51198 / DSM 5511 / JCM 9101 / NCIMB 13204 / VKM B-1734 / 4k) TaxID=543526 RepID=D2S0Y0_HALTV|nr:HalOD1 output domain-containing protein [Haloterrigena turkmenica]ADB63027.1 hypothetical protein Htur_4206 [Haloterrigena turkmenica DSM 5511]
MSAAIEYKAENPRLSVKVVEAIAAYADQSPVVVSEDGTDGIAPLYQTIDPDALDALFQNTAGEEPIGTVEFVHCGYKVTVESTGEITVTER